MESRLNLVELRNLQNSQVQGSGFFKTCDRICTSAALQDGWLSPWRGLHPFSGAPFCSHPLGLRRCALRLLLPCNTPLSPVSDFDRCSGCNWRCTTAWASAPFQPAPHLCTPSLCAYSGRRGRQHTSWWTLLNVGPTPRFIAVALKGQQLAIVCCKSTCFSTGFSALDGGFKCHCTCILCLTPCAGVSLAGWHTSVHRTRVSLHYQGPYGAG